MARKILIGVVSGILAVLIVWIFSQYLLQGFFYRFEAATYDWRMWYVAGQQPAKPIEDIVIVDVDARSVNKLGKFYQWPRSYWILALQHLSRGPAKWVAFDLIFDRDLRNPSEDEAFLSAIDTLGNVFGALYFTKADSEHFLYPMSSEPRGFLYERFQVSVPETLMYNLINYDRMEPDFTELLNSFVGLGFVNLIPDPDGVIRKIPLFSRFNEHVYPAFALAIALKELNVSRIRYDEKQSVIHLVRNDGENLMMPIDRWGRTLIYYHGPFQTFRYISFYDVLMGFVPAEYFKGRIVIFGSSLPGLFDLRSTPIQPAFPGVEINANVLYQILQQHFYRELSSLEAFLFLMIIAVFSGIVFSLFRPLGSIISAFFLSFFMLIFSFYVFSGYHYWIPLINSFLVILFAFLINYVYRYLIEEKDKRIIKKMFSHYVSASVVEELIKAPDKLKLGGEKKVCSVLFSDLAGFTTLSERLEPEELVKILNEYATEMTRIIFQYDGTLDKYEGDAIMALFGAPVDIGNHALKACQSAIFMQRRLEKIREEWKKRGWPEIYQRIGINTGTMIVGNMGSETRFDYTAVGDAVNLASRLEGANKLYDTNILIGEGTYQMAKDDILARLLDLIRVKGKRQPVKVYELIALKGDTINVRIREMLNHYQKGFQYYLSRNWDWAINQFRQALQIHPADGPSRLYLLRCQEFLQHPPPEDWDGVFTLKTK